MIDRIYLGDRSVKNIEIDTWNRNVRLKIDSISRLPHHSAEWNFYDKEDLEDGYLVFSNVSYFKISPEGSMPDDYIISFKINNIKTDCYGFEMAVGGNIQNEADSQCICYINIEFTDSWLENKDKLTVC